MTPPVLRPQRAHRARNGRGVVRIVPLAPDLRSRRLEPELMDAPGLDRGRHEQALRALARVNRVSWTSARVVAEVARLERVERRPLRVLDVACGGGDVARAVARAARRRGLDVSVDGCDVSETALDVARRESADTPGVGFFALDALSDPLPPGYDLICSSLFLHHLERPDAVRLVGAMAAATERSLLVQDLRRTRLGYLFAWVGLHGLTRSEVARSDGLTSVAAAFTISEAREIADDAGLVGARFRRCWPQRWALSWSRS